jgi:hypothetical protein
MSRPQRSEVWMVDLGLAAKARPCLLLTDWPADQDFSASHCIGTHDSTTRQPMGTRVS